VEKEDETINADHGRCSLVVWGNLAGYGKTAGPGLDPTQSADKPPEAVAKFGTDTRPATTITTWDRAARDS